MPNQESRIDTFFADYQTLRDHNKRAALEVSLRQLYLAVSGDKDNGVGLTKKIMAIADNYLTNNTRCIPDIKNIEKGPKTEAEVKLSAFLEKLKKVEDILKTSQQNLPIENLQQLTTGLEDDISDFLDASSDLDANAQTLKNAKNVYDAAQNFLNVTAGVISAGIAFANAGKMISSFDYWLNHELTARTVLINQGKELDNIFMQLKPSKFHDNESLLAIENNLFKYEKNDDYKTLSLKKYRQALKKVLIRGDFENSKEAIGLIVQLERAHLQRKIDEIEHDITARTIVSLNTNETNNDKVQSTLKKYYDTTDFSKNLANSLKNEIPTPTQDQLTRNTKCLDNLQGKKTKHNKRLGASICLLIAAGLGVACVVAPLFFTPAPLLILGLAAGAMLAIYVANKIDPTLKDRLTEGAKGLKNKLTKEFTFWRTKEKAQEDVSSKRDFPPTLLSLK